jgi:1-hydroxycarotenoid 3,4-desaturase
VLARTGNRNTRVVVVGAGIGGLASTLLLADAGVSVTVLESRPEPGGKLRTIGIGGRRVDSGPTVLTMRHVFDALLGSVGERLADHLTLQRAGTLARHFWPDGSALDLFEDRERSAEAIRHFAGAREAEAYRAFCKTTAAVHATLAPSFIEADTPSVAGLVRSSGLTGLPDLWRIRAFSTLWSVICGQFRDPRMRQLFARYATYCGSSPFRAPGPLMLVAHVEQSGVWIVRQGMHELARVFERLARARGAEFVYGCSAARIDVERGAATAVIAADGRRFPCEAVIFNGDPAALADCLLGADASHATPRVLRKDRSLSAVTLSMAATVAGVSLGHHNVFFSGDYEAEFASIDGRRSVPGDPTVYLCAQDRGGADLPTGPERLFTIVNAPADGDLGQPGIEEIETCRTTTLARLAAQGLTLMEEQATVTGPADFHRLFPATGGALYGRASHGWLASFRRPTARTAVKGLYLAGGAIHPGPGLPMAALSGRNAARAVIRDLGLTGRSHPAAMPGGTSTR